MLLTTSEHAQAVAALIRKTESSPVVIRQLNSHFYIEVYSRRGHLRGQVQPDGSIALEGALDLPAALQVRRQSFRGD